MNCNSATILVAGPNIPGRAFLSDNLTADGYAVRTAPTAPAAWEILCQEVVELLVIDISDFGRLDREGMELISAVRQSARTGSRADASLPIVVLTPRLGEIDRLRLFEHGCDDLVSHPYSYAELRARIAALLRRARGGWAPSRTRIGPLELDPGSRQVWLDAQPLDLSNKEYALLTVLASEPSRVFSRRELLERVWGFAGDDRTRTVDVHASRLRRKLTHARERFVINSWGEGYKLVTAVTADAPTSAPTSAAWTAPVPAPALSLVQRAAA